MRQRWERLTFLHWPFEPGDVQRLLPDGLTAETLDGAAWVGLVPFFMRVATPGGRRVPWLSNFCETNVRTYVRDREGRSGIWFFSLDAARLGAVAHRAGDALPAAVLLGVDAARRARLPRWPTCPGAAGPARARRTSRVRIAVGEPIAAGDVSEQRALPDRPLDAVQRHRRPPGLRPRLPPALAAAPRHGRGAGRRTSSPRPACPPRTATRWCTTPRASTSPSAAPSPEPRSSRTHRPRGPR